MLQELVGKTFKQWTEDDLYRHFGLKFKKEKCTTLENWLSQKASISDFEKKQLKRLRQKAFDNIVGWNEAELRAKLIDPITELVDFDMNEHFFSSFSEREMEIIIQQDIKLNGKVDWMVATGSRRPDLPFFFIHEYKKEEGTSNDPRGQLLITMLVAHFLHQQPPKPTLLNPSPSHYYKDMPIYGAYVLGRFWFFSTLHNMEYCFSNAFNATEEGDLYRIVEILKTQKEMIIKKVKH